MEKVQRRGIRRALKAVMRLPFSLTGRRMNFLGTFAVLLAATASAAASAAVTVDITCYAAQPGPDGRTSTRLVLQRYVDDALGREVGAFVRYHQSDKTIPLVFDKRMESQEDDPELGNFEVSWWELVDGRVSGQYKLTQTGVGVRQGQFLTYQSAKSKKTRLFQKYGSGEACTP